MTQTLTDPATTSEDNAVTPTADQRPAPAPRRPLKLRTVIAGRYSGPTETTDMVARADALAKSRTAVPEDARGNSGDILMYMEWALALDIPLAVSFQHVYFSDRGVPGIHAAFMHALVIRAGHRVETLFHDGRKCVLRLVYGDGRPPSPQVGWHVLEAQRAGLFVPRGDKNVWRLYGEDMLWARAVSRLCRRYAPDVTGGLHTPEELAEGVDETADVLVPQEPNTDDAGQPVVDPDVAEFLTAVETKTYDEIQQLWREAAQKELLNRYAGQDARGLNVTVQELLFDLGEVARDREAAAGTLTGGGVDQADKQHLTGMHQADEADAHDAANGEPPPPFTEGDAAGATQCCDPMYVLKHGNHLPGCGDYVEPIDSDGIQR